MGNCVVSKIGNSNPSISDRSITTPPSTAGTSNNYSNGGGYSATSSSEGTCCDGEIWPTPCLKIYSFADLKRSTANFNSVLGTGRFGTVFKGWVDKKTHEPCKFGTGMIVAIKKFNSESLQTYKEWEIEWYNIYEHTFVMMESPARVDITILQKQFYIKKAGPKPLPLWSLRKSEVNFLGRLSHPNLVKLLGYCWGNKDVLLVYEFMQQGSLADHLFRENPAIEPLSWDIRLKIAIGAARGLAFLHTSGKEIIHRNFKAFNILLDVNYNSKISNFCLAKLGPSVGNSHVTTQISGTYGYIAPEYFATGHLYVKSDVYNFGVVLLEMLSSLPVIDADGRPSGQHNLIDWARPLFSHKKKWKTIMDTRIEGQYSSKAALRAANLSLRCLKHEPIKRPSMKEVVEELEQIEAMKKEP